MRVGITTTIPVEVIFAAGHTPVDLNNIFITDPDPGHFVDKAHEFGFPRSLCSWIKAQHSVVAGGGVDCVVVVTAGDCSNTHALMELFVDSGVPVHGFAYPMDNRSENARGELISQITRMAEFFDTSMDAVKQQFYKMESVRRKLKHLDALTIDGYVSGGENHFWLVSSSDFNGNLPRFESELDRFLVSATSRRAQLPEIRLGFIGVPPIITDLYPYVRKVGADFIFNEVQRQFAIVSESPDYVTRYLDYTYPYDVFHRLNDIRTQTAARGIDGIVHYVQSFCHRQVQDILFKKHLPVPVLTMEADTPGALDERSKIRIDSFIEMLRGRKKRR